MKLDLASPREAATVLRATLAAVVAERVAELVAINNAAVLGPVGPVGSSDAAAIARHFSVNVATAAVFANAIVDAFQTVECPKTFVNISSGAAERVYAGWSLYCASKAALEALVRSMALEQAALEHPIRAININPGVMDTAMQAEVRAASVAEFPSLDRFVRLHAEGGLADPFAVAAEIAHLIASRPEPGLTYAIQRQAR